MLVIRRRAGESLVLDNRITLTVLDMRGGTVKLGISAPSDVKVHRKEVLDDVAAANRAAAGSLPDPKLVSRLAKEDRGDD